jgi:hypothetical protein
VIITGEPKNTFRILLNCTNHSTETWHVSVLPKWQRETVFKYKKLPTDKPIYEKRERKFTHSA